jgi:protein-disulfide isomerase
MGKAARQSARERVKAQRELERRQERRKRLVTIVTAVVVALAAVGAGWWWSVSQTTPEEAAGSLAPITVESDGSVVMAKAGVDKPVLDIYEDFQCPGCKSLEEVSGSTVKNLAAEGKVKVVYHPITIFGQDPTKSNSVRAGAASRCVPDGAQWMAFHDKLFAEQPSEAAEGFKIDDMVAWGKETGVTAPDFESCVTEQRHAQAHLDYSKKILDAKLIKGTPTVILDGTDISNEAFSPGSLRQAVENAAN